MENIAYLCCINQHSLYTMKWNLFIALVLSFITIASCDDAKDSKTLDSAEFLMSERPDSALSLLDKDIEGRLSYSSRMRYLLLRTEAMDKCYIRLDSLSYMTEVCDYYESHGSRMERARAYYMLGGVYRDKGNTPQALVAYKDAVKQLPNNCSKNEHRLLSRIYGQMATLFFRQRYPQQEISMIRKSSFHAEKAQDTLMAIHVFSDIAGVYWELGNIDSARYIARETYNRFVAIGADSTAASMLGFDIEYYLRVDSIEEAKLAIDEYIVNSGLMMSNGRYTKDVNVFFNFYLGKYYEKVGNADSAIYYYRELVRRGNRMNHLENAYRGLMSTYEIVGMQDSVMKYAELFANANDSANKLNSASEISRTNALYDYTESQQKALEESEENSFLWKLISFSIVCLAVTCVVLYRYLLKRDKKYKQELSLINEEYYCILSKYGQTKRELKSLDRGLNQIIADKTSEIEKLRNSLMAFQETNISCWDIEQSLMQHEVVLRFHKYATKIISPSNVEWKDLMRTVKMLSPDFYNMLLQPSLKLNDNEFKVCVLTRLNFIPTEMVVLIGRTKQQISNLRSSSNKKIFNGEGTKNFDKNIQFL